MSAAQQHLIALPAEHDPARAREFDFDATPRGVVREVVGYIADVYRRTDEPLRIMDPSAGAGVYGSELRRLYPSAEIIAIEPRAEEKDGLERHYDSVFSVTFEDAAEAHINHGKALKKQEREVALFDIIITNPPFKHFEAFIELAHQLVNPGGLICFLGLTQWGQAAASAELFKRLRPWRQLRIGGRVGFRGAKGQTDSREYSHWLWWVPTMEPAYTELYQLPTLPAEARKWRQRPGAETPAGLARLDAVLKGAGL